MIGKLQAQVSTCNLSGGSGLTTGATSGTNFGTSTTTVSSNVSLSGFANPIKLGSTNDSDF